MTFITRSKCQDGKVQQSTVCADSAALWDAGVNNDGLAAGSEVRQKVSEGVCTNLIDSTKAASAINLMVIII